MKKPVVKHTSYFLSAQIEISQTVLRVFILLLVGLFWTCSSHDELQPPDNPLDPDNPVYVSPSVDIISGPGEGEVVTVTAVTFEWQGNESASEYSYQFDASGWSDWVSTTNIQLDYLDEGEHNFQVLARSYNGEEQTTPTSTEFVVDAVAGPAAVVQPYRQSGSPGDTLVYQIIAEEVTELFAVECDISIDDEYLELIEVVDGNILDEWGGEALRIQTVTDASVSLSLVAVEGTNLSFSGTTSILTLRFKVRPDAIISSEIMAISLSEITYLDPALEAIDITANRGGVLDVQ